MKILVKMYKGYEENSTYKMTIVDTTEIGDGTYQIHNSEDINIQKLKECVNVQVNEASFKDAFQNPNEYLSASYDVNKLIDWGVQSGNFIVTNIYYDENNQPQLYRVVNVNGESSIHDISEFNYNKKFSVLGDSLETLPEFIKKEPLSAAYEWWKQRDEVGKKSNDRFLSTQFKIYKDIPVKLLYHYLIGVKGFQVGYHTVTEVVDGRTVNMQHEYMLFKDTANIKLRESLPKEEKLVSYNQYSMFDFSSRPIDNFYPEERKIGYYGTYMSMICDKDKYPVFNYNTPINSRLNDKDSIVVDINFSNGNDAMAIYNKLEESGCISKEWRLGEYGLDGTTLNNLLPNEIALLSVRLQNEKENYPYMHSMVAYHGLWSVFNTDKWMKTLGLAFAIQYYNPDLREKLTSIFQKYPFMFSKELGGMIENLSAKNALEAMMWAKENMKVVLSEISLVKSEGNVLKSNISLVDQMSGYFTFKRNNYPLPDWLQIYSPQTIDAMGGVQLLQEGIKEKGEANMKEAYQIIAEMVESEMRDKKRLANTPYVKPEDIINEETSKMKM